MLIDAARLRLHAPVLCLALLAALPVAGHDAERSEDRETDLELSWHLDARFYGDNTEFFNDFRTGETLLGAQIQTWVDLRTSERTSFRFGVFGDEYFQADAQFDQVLPLVGFRYSSKKVDFLIGHLETVDRHGLLEPLAVQQLEITRPVETGVQVLVHTARHEMDAFLNWQELNTPNTREVVDYGVRLHRSIGERFKIGAQGHGWHQGGQNFMAGMPVIENGSAAVGLELHGPLGKLGNSSAEFYTMVSLIDTPPITGAEKYGYGFYLRLTARPVEGLDVWLVGWSGHDFFFIEGDRHYSSVGETTLVPDREYYEGGARYRLAGGGNVHYDAEMRVSWVEDDPEYAFRFIVRIPVRLGSWRLGRGGAD